MTLLEITGVVPDRVERWCEKEERGLGRFGMGLLLALIFLFLACLYVTPELRTMNSGQDYERFSKDPFNWMPQKEGELRSRLLTPLIGWAIGLSGNRYIVLPILFGVVFMLAVYMTGRSRFGWSPGESCGAVAVIAFSTPILTLLYFQGYVDTTTYLLILLAWLTTESLGWAVFLALALLNHEGSIVVAPWLAFLAIGRRPTLLKAAKVILLLALAILPMALYHKFLVSRGLMYLNEGYYLRWEKVSDNIDYIGNYFAFGIFEGFKLFWFFPIVAMLSYVGERRYYELLGLCLLLGGALGQFLFASDVSRLVGIAFPAVLIGMNECRNLLKSYRTWLWGLFCFNLLAPQFYVAQRLAMPLPPLPVTFLLWCLSGEWQRSPPPVT